FDALPDRERRLLFDASVIGRTFWRSLLEMLDPDADVGAALAELETREFIRRDRMSLLEGHDAYSFRHISLREVAYNTLPRPGRRGGGRAGGAGEARVHPRRSEAAPRGRRCVLVPAHPPAKSGLQPLAESRAARPPRRGRALPRGVAPEQFGRPRAHARLAL